MMLYSRGISSSFFAVVLLFTARPAFAQVAEIIHVSSAQKQRATLLNPEQSFDIRSPTHETALILFEQHSIGATSSLSYRLRGEYDSGEDTRFDAQVQELSISGLIGESWIVNVGKTQLSWDMSTSFQPLGFFQDGENLFDLTDVQSRSSGIPLVAATYLSPSWSATFVYGHDKWSTYDGLSSGVEQWAARVQLLSDGYDLSFVVQKPAGQSVGAGLSLVLSPADFMVSYVSAFYRQGTRRPQNQLLNSAENQLVDFFPFSFSERQSDTPYWRAVFGSTFAFKHADVTLEFSHDERGLDETTWSRLTSQIRYHNELLGSETDPDTRELIAANLWFNSQTIIASGSQQSYVFAFVKSTFDPVSASVFSRLALQDGSALVGMTLESEINPNLTLSANMQAFTGDDVDEFGLTPIGTSFQLTLRYVFN